MAAFASAIGAVLGLSLIVFWPWYRLVLGGNQLAGMPFGVVIIVAMLAPMRAVTQQMITVFAVSGRGMAIAIQILAQSLFGLLMILVSLFVFDAGVTALFLGTLAGNLAALSVGLWMLGVDHLVTPPSRRWLGLIFRTAPTATAGGFAEAAWNFGANAVLGQLRGLNAVGIFGQARLYQGFLVGLGNAVARNAFSLSLAEARDSGSQFAATRRAWVPVYVAIVVFGLIFAFVGREIVALLTNGKLTPAAAYIPLFAVLTLIQNSGKAANAIVFEADRAAAGMRVRTVLIILSLLALYPTVAAFGIDGVLGLLLIEALAYRASLRVLASAIRRPPWQDDTVVIGVVTLLASSFYVRYFDPPLSLRLGILAIILVAIVGFGHRILAEVMSAGRELLYPRSV
jgi:O-antigen/teichoic acid export membrane protein